MRITEATFAGSSTTVAGRPEQKLPEFAFIGRSNVGKSSLINMLCGNRKLAMTSSQPGKTRLVNHFLINREWYLVDLPGYGYATASKSMRDKLKRIIESYILFREQLTNLFVLIDCRLPPQRIDLDFMQWLGESHVPFSIVFTKKDKLSNARFNENIEAYKQTLLETWEELPPMFFTSSEKREGRDELLDYIDHINQELKK